MRILILSVILLFFSVIVYCGTPPMTLEYCTGTYNGVVSNGTSLVCYGTNGIMTRSTDQGASWQRMTMNTQSDIIRMDTMQSGFVALTKSALLVSTDNAKTWKRTAVNAAVDFCRRNDTIYILTTKQLLRTSLPTLGNMTTLFNFDISHDARHIIATAHGTLHWIEDSVAVRNYSVASNTSTLTVVTPGTHSHGYSKVVGLQSTDSALYMAVVDVTPSDHLSSTSDYTYYHFLVSTDLGASFSYFIPNYSIDENFTNILHFHVVNDSQIVALRKNFVKRIVPIPSPGSNSITTSLAFLCFDYLEFDINGGSRSINSGDTILERYTCSSDQQISAIVRVDDTTLVGAGNQHCIIRSTDNGAHWKFCSYFPHDEPSRMMRSPNASTLYIPSAKGTFYRTTDGGVTILPQRFKFYPQYLNSSVVFAHYDELGNGCVILATGKERDSNVFVTHDFGDTYKPVNCIRLFNAYAADSVNRQMFRLTDKEINGVVETDNMFLLAGRPTYLDTSFSMYLKLIPHSVVVRLDKNFRFVDTIPLPVEHIKSLVTVGNRVYAVGMNLSDYGYRDSVKEVSYPTYKMFVSTNEGKFWDPVSTSLPLPNEYATYRNLYYAAIANFQPACVYDNHLVFQAGTTRLLRYALDTKTFDTLHLPDDLTLASVGNTLIPFRNGIISAGYHSALMWQSDIHGALRLTDSTRYYDYLPWDSTSSFYGFIPSNSDTGFAAIGQYAGMMSIITQYKTQLLRYRPYSILSNVENDDVHENQQELVPYPQPTHGMVSISIKYNNSDEPHSIQASLHDILGNTLNSSAESTTVQVHATQPNIATIQVDCSTLASGLYIARIQLHGGLREVLIVVY